ncbi:MAG: hypothetical protein RSE13_25235 [Planktothrix sp. GU0601_MAG3]|nr:MAG: hypothetical protein RSE13_25235 [Planktothrix sp. GU0601_MAG3]
MAPKTPNNNFSVLIWGKIAICSGKAGVTLSDDWVRIKVGT